MRGRGANEQFGTLQEEIVISNLVDFRRWVDERTDDQGDVQKVCKGVQVLAVKPQRPSPNITTDQDGNTLQDSEDVEKS